MIGISWSRRSFLPSSAVSNSITDTGAVSAPDESAAAASCAGDNHDVVAAAAAAEQTTIINITIVNIITRGPTITPNQRTSRSKINSFHASRA